MTLIKHGRHAYTSGQCKCDEICKPANTTYMRERKRANKKKWIEEGFLVEQNGRTVNTHPKVPHGTSSGHGYWLCRCEKCSATKRRS